LKNTELIALTAKLPGGMRIHNVVTFGEALLRLTPTSKQCVEQTEGFDATIGETGFNVALEVARLEHLLHAVAVRTEGLHAKKDEYSLYGLEAGINSEAARNALTRP